MHMLLSTESQFILSAEVVPNDPHLQLAFCALLRGTHVCFQYTAGNKAGCTEGSEVLLVCACACEHDLIVWTGIRLLLGFTKDLRRCWCVQVQHVFAVLHKTGGGTRRTAMTELRQYYESNLKFSGKV